MFSLLYDRVQSPIRRKGKKVLLDNSGSLPFILKSFGLFNSDAHEVSTVTAVKKAGNPPRRLKLVQVMLFCIKKVIETLHSCLFTKEPSCDVPIQHLTQIPHFVTSFALPLRNLDTGYVLIT